MTWQNESEAEVASKKTKKRTPAALPAPGGQFDALQAAVEQGLIGADTLLAAQSGTAGPDYWRQLDLFAPEKFGDIPVHVIGVGATGSWIALFLAKMGIANIHIYDYDFVEPHNLPPQLYYPKHVGLPKVEALAAIIEEATGTKVTKHQERVTGQNKFSGYVFLLVDSMRARQEIWEGSIRYKINVKLMIETRMAIDNSRIFAIIPTAPEDVKIWENNWYSDEEAEAPVCSNQAIVPTSVATAGFAVWKLIKAFNQEEYGRQTVLCHRPSVIVVDK